MLSPEDTARFRELVRERAGLHLPESRLSDLERAVGRATAEGNLPDADALYRLLRRGKGPSDTFDALMSALNVGETYFFRDAGQIEALEREILPELIARRSPQRRLRIWSAACSSGEEAYTLAILASRLLPDLPEWEVLVLGTDLNARSLDLARRGVYGAWSFRAVPPLVRATHFIQRGDRFEVGPRIRSMVSFAQLNLVEDPYPSPTTSSEAMDLILCRNALLYFDEESARRVVGRLRDALADGGWLLVSSVEAGLRLFDGFEPQAFPGVGAYRKLRPASAAIGLPSRAPPVGRWPAAPQPAPLPETAIASTPLAAEDHAAPHPTPGPVEPDRGGIYEEALTLWKNGRSEDALERLDAARDREPLAARVHYLRGLIDLDEGRVDGALAAFRRCIYADPRFVPAHLAQAGLFARLGLRGRARAALEHAARLVADQSPEAPVPGGDGLTVNEVLGFVAAYRELVGHDATREPAHG